MAAASGDEHKDVRLFEELSRLNNELSDMHRELAQKNVALEKLNNQKNLFLGMASHDIRKPLSVIASYAELLQEELSGTVDADTMKFLEIIYNTSMSSIKVLGDFLDLSKIEAGRLVLERRPSALLPVIQSAIQANEQLVQQKNALIILNAPEALPDLVIDQNKIRQVLDNLIGNAVKFSPADKPVEVDVAVRGSVFISVRDHGDGVPESERENIFNPYVKSMTRSVANEKGTGLGLAIAKMIVDAHGGKLWCEEADGGGARFCVELPNE